MASEINEILVVGAGLSGLSAARVYLDVHPNSKLTILERGDSVGGPWGKSRIYPGFWSQSGIRMSGFSDVPLTVPEGADVFNDIFEAKYVTEYLEKYIDCHKYADKTLRERIKLGVAVSRVEKIGGIWQIEGTQLSDGTIFIFNSKRVIVATGTTSDPKMPSLPGSEQLNGTIIHQSDYGRFATQRELTPKRVAVLGAGKSAADAVYNEVKAGNEVHWIIRKSGKGPGVFTNPADNAKGPFLNDPELAATRLFGTMSPPCFTQPNLWTRFLHGTAMGSKIIDGFFGPAVEKCKRIGDFHNREGALPGFELLESDVNLFWCTGPFGMIQRPEFWDVVARNVHVHRADIEKLEDHIIAFRDGTSVPIDVIICATGFRNDYPFFTESQHTELGLPHEPLNDETETRWTELEANADAKVVYQFPKLANPPKVATPHPGAHKTPNRLYNCIAPLGDNSIAFVGNVYVPNGFRVAETQALWTTAYFDGMLNLPSAEDMQKDIAWVNALQKRRYPAHGSKGNYFHYDMMGYIDSLLAQIGLVKHKKGWWGDLVYPFVAADLKAAGAEYVDKYREINGS